MYYLKLVTTLILFFLICVSVHELGHVLGAKFAGMGFGRIYIGPFIIVTTERKVLINKKFSSLWFGACIKPYSKYNLNNLVKRYSISCYAGPITSLIWGTLIIVIVMYKWSYIFLIMGVMSIGIGFATIFSDIYNAIFYLKRKEYGNLVILDTMFNSWHSLVSLNEKILDAIKTNATIRYSDKIDKSIKSLHMKHIISGIIESSSLNSEELERLIDEIFSKKSTIDYTSMQLLNYYILYINFIIEDKNRLINRYQQKYNSFISKSKFKDKFLNLECCIVSSLIKNEDARKYLIQLKELNCSLQLDGYEFFWTKIIDDYNHYV